MTLWEFACCREGHRRFHQSEEDAPPTMSDDMLAELGVEGF